MQTRFEWSGGILKSVTLQTIGAPEGSASRARVGFSDRLWLAASLALSSICIGAAVWQRLGDGYSNVDDYLYSEQARTIYAGLLDGPLGLARAWRIYGTNSPLYATLAAPITPMTHSPGGFLLLQVPIWLSVVTAAYLLTFEMTKSRGAASLALFVSGSLPGVTGYAVMLNFALMATSAVMWSAYAYLRSDCFLDRRWSVAVGAAMGLVLLSRVIAIVYFSALAAVMLGGSVRTIRAHREVRMNVIFASLVTVLLAGPWWILCGRQALRYLLDAGYSAGSGFVTGHSLGALLQTRMNSMVDLMGLGVVLILSLSAMAALAHRPPGVGPLAASSGLILLALSTSSNPGTGFELPAFILAVPVAVVGVHRHRAGVLMLAGGVGAAVLLQFAAPGWRVPAVPNLWVSSYPGRVQLLGALGTRDVIDTSVLNRQLAQQLAGQRTVVLRDDPAVNIPSIQWFQGRSSLSIWPIPYGMNCPSSADLSMATRVVWGNSLYPYHSRLDPACVTEALEGGGYALLMTTSLSPSNQVEVWGK